MKEMAWNVVLQSEEERTLAVKGMKRPSTKRGVSSYDFDAQTDKVYLDAI